MRMELGAWLYLLAGLVLVAGVIYSVRQTPGRMRIFGLIATLALTAVVAWLAWFSTNVTSGGNAWLVVWRGVM